ncbi:MAG: methionine adenosyltransferase [Nitrospirota bacterium]
MARQIIVKPLSRLPIEQHTVELCEHKGVGHPDTIADAVCEAASRELSLAYLNSYGRVLHHNLDKGLLVAGKSVPRFGGGTCIEPIKIIVCGRATNGSPAINVRAIVGAAARRALERHVRCDPAHFDVVTEIREGSANLKEVFARGEKAPLANDTSFGCGYAPYSRLEQTVLAFSRLLKSSEFRAMFPAAGDDFKIMGHRVNGRLHVTIALAFVDRHVEGVPPYFAIKRAMRDYLAGHLDAPAEIRINTLDDPAAKDESGVYLTVTGLSAEMGDDGQVGRGNRVNSLITPNRNMSLEAAAGKNPVSHVGKLYNVLAMLMARDLHERVEEIAEVSVSLLSAIGEPTDQPQVAAIEVAAQHGISPELIRKATTVADEWLEKIGTVTELILNEQVTVY